MPIRSSAGVSSTDTSCGIARRATVPPWCGRVVRAREFASRRALPRAGHAQTCAHAVSPPRARLRSGLPQAPPAPRRPRPVLGRDRPPLNGAALPDETRAANVASLSRLLRRVRGQTLQAPSLEGRGAPAPSSSVGVAVPRGVRRALGRRRRRRWLPTRKRFRRRGPLCPRRWPHRPWQTSWLPRSRQRHPQRLLAANGDLADAVRDVAVHPRDGSTFYFALRGSVGVVRTETFAR